MIPFFIFVFGLIIGSFLNAVIHRLRTKESIVTKRSACPKCHHILAAIDLVPLLSFAGLWGKCRYCRKPISWQYPLVELFTATIFVLGYSVIGIDNSLALLAFYIFSSFLIVIFVYDLKHYLILDRISLPALFIALVLNFLLGKPVINLILAAAIPAVFFLLQLIISKGKWIGGGDIRLGLVMGAMLGWPLVLVALSLSYISGAIIGVILIIIKRKKLDSQIPFGTFLSVTTLATLLYGNQLLNWYLNYLGKW